MAKLIIRKGRTKPLWHGHPWIYAQAVSSRQGEAQAGDVVDVVDTQGTFIGRAAYSPASSIVARMLTRRQDEPIDASWVKARLATAVRLRRRLGLPSEETNCYRLINSEGDGMPGFVVDAYGSGIAVQITTRGAQKMTPWLLDALAETLCPETIVEVEPGSFAKTEGIEASPRMHKGESSVVECREHGLTYQVDLLHAQKTGLYLDQRVNRGVFAQLCADQRVLDCYCYVGGFALNAARAGARSVVAVDSSPRAVAMVRHHASLNKLDIESIESDAFRYLSASEANSFDVAVLDPPKFARQRTAVSSALSAYRKLFSHALRVVRDGGMIAVACCSQLVDTEQLIRTLSGAAVEPRHVVKVLQIGRAGPDHPIIAGFNEGDYLRFILLSVDKEQPKGG